MTKRFSCLLALAALACAVVAAPASAKPRISFAPSTVLPGDPTLVRGKGFPARKRVRVTIEAEGGRTVKTRTNRHGRFRRAIAIPAAAPEGRFKVVACTRRCASRAAKRLTVSTSGFTRWIRRGDIEPGRGAAGITLGMLRSDVLDRLGRPFFKTVPGYMQYTPATLLNIFDVYTAGSSLDAPVKQIVVAFGSFRVDGIAVFKPGALRALAERYGDRLRRTQVESGEFIYRLVTPTAGGGETWTDFFPDRQDTGLDARVLNVILIDPS